MVKSKLHVAVVGGGIGGLFAANALMANGNSVLVYCRVFLVCGLFQHQSNRLTSITASPIWGTSRLNSTPLFHKLFDRASNGQRKARFVRDL